MNKRLLVDEIAAAIRTRPAPVGAASLAETIMEEVFPSDGCVVGGVFYPFMVDCPNCEGTGQVSPSYSGCPDCYSDGKKRNPALEWRCRKCWHTDPHPIGEVQFCLISKSHGTIPAHDPVWVAVGVKETEG